jgi:formyl-CoA transferase/CoA:oxalate CoA-transferase
LSALQGIRVLELGRVYSGPLCGMLLADLGARVLKVERPGLGDESRSFGATAADGNTCYFDSLNRNKQSVALDLACPADRDLFTGLVREADVLVHNWVQEALDKLGFDYEAVAALNPRLVYCDVSGYGRGTPAAARPSQDILAQALSGLMSLTGEPAGPPLRTGVPVVDHATGLYAALAIVAALLERERTGRGQRVSVSLLGTAAALTAVPAATFLSTGRAPARTGNSHPAICPYGLYATQDAPVVLAVANDAMWVRCCRALGLAALGEDPRFATNAGRVQHRAALDALLGQRLAAEPSLTISARLEQARVSCAPVQDLAAAFRAGPVADLGLVVACGPEDAVRLVGSPVQLGDSPPPAVAAPPRLGQHTEEIRRRRDW